MLACTEVDAPSSMYLGFSNIGVAQHDARVSRQHKLKTASTATDFSTANNKSHEHAWHGGELQARQGLAELPQAPPRLHLHPADPPCNTRCCWALHKVACITASEMQHTSCALTMQPVQMEWAAIRCCFQGSRVVLTGREEAKHLCHPKQT